MKTYLGVSRLPFLLLTPACVVLGLGTAYWETGHVNWLYFVLALIGALAAHISVNALNEYYDFRSGLDTRTQRTPFSGGSGTLPANPAEARKALLWGLFTLAVTAAIGIYFLAVRGWGLLPLGVAGVALVYLYTVWVTKSPLASLIAPGLGFGTFMVMGTDYVLTGGYHWAAFWASLTPFFLVNDLLLLNQFPDVEADRSVGRRNYPIVLGRPAAAKIYVAFLALAYLSPVVAVALGYLPAWSLLGLLTLVLAVPTAQKALRHADDLPNLMPALGNNVLINLLTPVLMAVGLWLA
ncbi:MAG TPA: prenyltransferase [Chloroflexi bacterium]|nr:prenyltransferase [Chloroflexota bacterium]